VRIVLWLTLLLRAPSLSTLIVPGSIVSNVHSWGRGPTDEFFPRVGISDIPPQFCVGSPSEAPLTISSPLPVEMLPISRHIRCRNIALLSPGRCCVGSPPEDLKQLSGERHVRAPSLGRCRCRSSRYRLRVHVVTRQTPQNILLLGHPQHF
jgi:hypothetical protein